MLVPLTDRQISDQDLGTFVGFLIAVDSAVVVRRWSVIALVKFGERIRCQLNDLRRIVRFKFRLFTRIRGIIHAFQDFIQVRAQAF